MKILYKFLIIKLVLFAFSAASYADQAISLDLFYIERNKNKNLVQYSIFVDRETCQPIKSEAVHVFWKMLEKGQNVTEELLSHEQPAYGVYAQKKVGRDLEITLNAMKERSIAIKTSKKGNSCKANAYTSIKGNTSRLSSIYIFAKKRLFLWPVVQWIKVRGVINDMPVVEKFTVN